MESLLRMSGLLGEDETGKTDLGTLEKRLAEKASTRENSSPQLDSSAPKSSSASIAPQDSPKPRSQRESLDTPRENVTSPSSDGDKPPNRADVENLSEAMCSLVTNNVGETRYIGTR
jgi:hypothetical protein